MMMICILLLNRCGHTPIHIVPFKFLFILQFVGALVLVSLAHFLRNVLRLFATWIRHRGSSGLDCWIQLGLWFFSFRWGVLGFRSLCLPFLRNDQATLYSTDMHAMHTLAISSKLRFWAWSGGGWLATAKRQNRSASRIPWCRLSLLTTTATIHIPSVVIYDYQSR